MTPPPLHLQIVQHLGPSNRSMRCPLFTFCDAPAFTKGCLGSNEHPCNLQFPPFAQQARCSSSGSFEINGKGDLGHGGKGKPESPGLTWGGVKALYR